MRGPREIAAGYPHHLVLRGNNKRRLFSRHWEYVYFLKLLREAAGEHAVPIHALALMANHVHLIVTPPDETAASMFVKTFAQEYALARNKIRDGTGKLFEQRFKSEVLATDGSMARMTAYVDLNPANAGLCKTGKVARWSTHGLHVGRGEEAKVPASIWTPSPWYLGLGATERTRQAIYAAWVEEYRSRQEIVRSEKRVASRLEVRRPDRRRAT